MRLKIYPEDRVILTDGCIQLGAPDSYTSVITLGGGAGWNCFSSGQADYWGRSVLSFRPTRQYSKKAASGK